MNNNQKDGLCIYLDTEYMDKQDKYKWEYSNRYKLGKTKNGAGSTLSKNPAILELQRIQGIKNLSINHG